MDDLQDDRPQQDTEQRRFFEEDAKKQLDLLKIRLSITQDELRDLPYKQRELMAREAHVRSEISILERTLPSKASVNLNVMNGIARAS